MFYYLTELRDFFFAFNIFKYITFRAAMAAVTTFLICVIMGPIFIRYLQKRRLGEIAKREDCPDLAQFHSAKEGTPTMGGILIIGSIVVSVLLWTDLTNPFVLLTLLTCIYLGILGFIDDYMKLTKRGKHKRGLRARTKFLWQTLLGLLVGAYVYFYPGFSGELDVPFFKNLVIDLGIFYLPFVALVLIGSSNGVNLTDGLDGLAIGCVLIASLTLGILCYITGHVNFSAYLFIPHIPRAGELTIFCSAIMGASLGFLWFNSHPATIFMGDTGSLPLGGSLGAIAIFIKKELLLGLIGGVFAIEALSVILQVMSFKLRKKRIFKVSPLHHHLQLCGWHESKIIIRFWIIGIILAWLALTTLKLR